MAAKKERATQVGGESAAGLLSPGQVVTTVVAYPDGGSETIHRGTVVGSSGPAVKIKKDERETVVNTWSLYFIKAEIEQK
jgi:hypothetical protein